MKIPQNDSLVCKIGKRRHIMARRSFLPFAVNAMLNLSNVTDLKQLKVLSLACTFKQSIGFVRRRRHFISYFKLTFDFNIYSFWLVSRGIYSCAIKIAFVTLLCLCNKQRSVWKGYKFQLVEEIPKRPRIWFGPKEFSRWVGGHFAVDPAGLIKREVLETSHLELGCNWLEACDERNSKKHLVSLHKHSDFDHILDWHQRYYKLVWNTRWLKVLVVALMVLHIW